MSLPVVVFVFVLMFLLMRMVVSLVAGGPTELSDLTRAEKGSDVIVWFPELHQADVSHHNAGEKQQ